MRKTVLLCMFFYVSGLCCFADESTEASPLFPFYGLPVQTFWSTDNTLVWKQADWGIIEYADEGGTYRTKNFFEAYPQLSLPLALTGFIVGALVSPFVLTSSKSNEVLGIGLMLGGTMTCTLGVLWFVFTL